jgi:uracil-DNA glycosylase
MREAQTSQSAQSRRAHGGILARRGMNTGTTSNLKESESTRLDDVLNEVRACAVCAAHLPHTPRPVLRATASARNRRWLKLNGWFERDVLPELRKRFRKTLMRVL